MTSIHELEAEPFELEPEANDELEPESYDELELDELEYDELETTARPVARTPLPWGKPVRLADGVVQRTHPKLGWVWSVPRAKLPSTLRELQEEIVDRAGRTPPPDERVVVKDTTAIPYRWICRIELNFGPDPTTPGSDIVTHGTGLLISPRHVLTAGHCLHFDFPGAAGRALRAARIVPGYNCLTKTGEPLGAARGTRFQPHARWRDHRDDGFDYGLITLGAAIGDSTPKALGGKKLGYWGSPTDGAGTRINPTTADLTNFPIHTAGYPGDFCCMRPTAAAPCPRERRGTAQFRAFARVTDPAPAAAPRLIFYDADSMGGQSGSPVWYVYKELRNVIAVHSGPAFPFDAAQRGRANCGVRITEDVMTQVRAWMRD
jgi:V8-like Glu-specific endopeptidase